MPPRQPALPEGTDHIVAGASGSGEAENGFVASAGGSSGTDRLVSQVKDQVTTCAARRPIASAASPTTARARSPACSKMSAK